MKTLLTFVQDETGSMLHRAEATISAFNEYFNTLKSNRQDLGEVIVHAWQFSDASCEERVRPLHRGDLEEVPALDGGNYRPRGVTPLLDAVGTALQQAAAVPADRYLFIVQTDGLENASKDFTREQVQRLVTEKEQAENWTLVFLGAGISEWVKQVAMMGVAAGSSSSYSGDSASTRAVYQAAAGQTVSLLSTAQSSHKSMAADIEQDVKDHEATT